MQQFFHSPSNKRNSNTILSSRVDVATRKRSKNSTYTEDSFLGWNTLNGNTQYVGKLNHCAVLFEKIFIASITFCLMWPDMTGKIYS